MPPSWPMAALAACRAPTRPPPCPTHGLEDHRVAKMRAFVRAVRRAWKFATRPDGPTEEEDRDGAASRAPALQGGEGGVVASVSQSVSQSFFAIATRPPDPSPSGNRHTNIRGGAVAWREFPRGTHAGAVAPRPVGRTHTHAPGLRVPGYRPAQVGVPHSRVGHHATRTPHAHIHTYRWVEHGRDPGALKCAPASTERCAHPVVLKQRSHHPPLLLHRVRFPWPPPRIAPRCLGQPV